MAREKSGRGTLTRRSIPIGVASLGRPYTPQWRVLPRSCLLPFLPSALSSLSSALNSCRTSLLGYQFLFSLSFSSPGVDSTLQASVVIGPFILDAWVQPLSAVLTVVSVVSKTRCGPSHRGFNDSSLQVFIKTLCPGCIL